MTVLEIRSLGLVIHSEGRDIPILEGVSLAIQQGQILGLAGESGSGKTMTGLSVMGLEPKNSTLTGAITVDGAVITGPDRKRRLAELRGSHMAMVFQDPTTSLHPMLTIESQLTDHARLHLGLDRAAARDRAAELLRRVGIDRAGSLKRYPHEFSGGQRQRIAIASALMCSPKLLIADEVTTALDVTVQAGILRLIRGLAEELGLAVLFISHDLGVISALADDVAVMQRGAIVEAGPRLQVFTEPEHAYTKALLASLPGAKGGLASREDLYRIDLKKDL
ncbi:MAG: ABC transporter ATP-binding protein [Bifidobacteriaceae bacterium]|nr:ABC transporter ATP-binding protein [Bifidobacteriaceae bacterium]